MSYEKADIVCAFACCCSRCRWGMLDWISGRRRVEYAVTDCPFARPTHATMGRYAVLRARVGAEVMTTDDDIYAVPGFDTGAPIDTGLFPFEYLPDERYNRATDESTTTMWCAVGAMDCTAMISECLVPSSTGANSAVLGWGQGQLLPEALKDCSSDAHLRGCPSDV